MRTCLSIPTQAAVAACGTCEPSCPWLAMFPCKIAIAVVLVHALGAILCLRQACAADDPLEDLEQQVRKELRQADSVQRPEIPPPVPGARQPDARQPGYLGIIADDRQTGGTGVQIVHLAPNGPAARAGLREGDLMTAIDGHALRQMRDLAQILTGSQAGKKLHVTVERNQQSREVDVTLDNRPPPGERLLPDFGRIPAATGNSGATGQPPTTSLGLRIAPLTETARRQHNLPVVAGVLVTGVTAGSPAQRAGVPAGSVIVAIGGKPVRTTERFDQLIAEALPTGVVELTYYNRGELADCRLRLDAAPRTVESQRPAPRPPSQALAPENLLQRLRQLERRVDQLERRIDQLQRTR